MKSISATEARKSLYRLLDEVTVTSEPIQITGKRGSAVLVSEDDWRAIEETIYLMSIPGMTQSIRDGHGDAARGLRRGARLVKRWRVVYTRQAAKDAKRIAAAGLKEKASYLLRVLSEDPYRNPPPFEKLVGDLAGATRVGST